MNPREENTKECPLCSNRSLPPTCDCGYSFQLGEIPKDNKDKVKSWYESSPDWFEKLQRLKRIHEIQVKKHGDPIIYRYGSWRQQDTADLLGYRSRSIISLRLDFAKITEKHPHLKSFKSFSEAKRYIDSGGSAEEFDSEEQLQEYFEKNWHKTPFGKEWELVRKGKYDAKEVGIIDLLARHKKTPELLVVELKVRRSSVEAFGQLLRYMGWVKYNLAKDDEIVRGLIVGGFPTLNFLYALLCTSNIEFYMYDLKNGMPRFMKMDAASVLRLNKLTPQQREQLLESI